MKKRSQNDPIPSHSHPLKLQVPAEPDLHPDDFEPRLPTRVLRQRGSVLGHLKGATRASKRSGSATRPASRRRSGVRGRCYGPRTYPQRVVVKARVVSGSGAQSTDRMRKHRTYLSRSGTGLSGKRPQFFNANGYCSHEELYQQGLTWVSDPHHFRFIISPEHGSQLDLEDYVRSVMQQVGADLKTRLEWYGVCHHNTDNAHAHVVMRGVDEHGEPLVISRDYLGHGMRHVAEREASVRLGMRHQGEVDRSLEQLLGEERFTFIDKELVAERARSGEGVVRVHPLGPNAREFAQRARLSKLRRLAFLESRGLSKEERAGVWRIDANLEEVLRELAHRRSIEQVVAPFLVGREEAKQDLRIYKESEEFGPTEVVGKVVARDLIDELYEKKFLLVSGCDGRNHFIPLGAFSEATGFECREGQVVRVVQQKPSAVRAEDVIIRYLGEGGGEFCLDQFQSHVSKEVSGGRWELPQGVSVTDYVERFASRCESLKKAGLIEELQEGRRWRVPGDVVQKAREFDAVANKKLKVTIIPESYRTVQEEIEIRGASWLDRITATASNHPALRAQGAFGLEVKRAVKRRQEVLRAHGVSRGVGSDPTSYRELLRRDENTLRARVENQTGCRVMDLSQIQNREVSGKVLGYELLSDGYRMLIRLDDGSVVIRPRGRQEGRIKSGTRVTVSVEWARGRGRDGETHCSSRVRVHTNRTEHSSSRHERTHSNGNGKAKGKAQRL